MARPRTRYIAVAITLGLLLGLLLAEMALRVSRYGPDALLPWVMNSVHPLGTSGLLRRSNIDILYELKPNQDRLYKKVPFRTNSAGLRDREYDREKPPDTFRVVVIGDSFTMPTGVAIEDAYHSRLERSLNDATRAAGGERRYEFLNFGVGGYQFPQYLATLRDRALDWQPDLILVGMSTNDHVYFSSLEWRLRKPYVVKDRTYPFFESEVLAWLTRRIQFGPGGPAQEARLTPVFREHVDQYFGRLAALARSVDTPLVVAYLVQYQWQFRSLIDEIRLIAESHGLVFLDTSLVFPEQEDLSLRIFPSDGHPNAAANEIFARYLEGELVERGLVPPPSP